MALVPRARRPDPNPTGDTTHWTVGTTAKAARIRYQRFFGAADLALRMGCNRTGAPAKLSNYPEFFPKLRALVVRVLQESKNFTKTWINSI
jgi:hypothetical protein